MSDFPENLEHALYTDDDFQEAIIGAISISHQYVATGRQWNIHTLQVARDKLSYFGLIIGHMSGTKWGDGINAEHYIKKLKSDFIRKMTDPTEEGGDGLPITKALAFVDAMLYEPRIEATLKQVISRQAYNLQDYIKQMNNAMAGAHRILENHVGTEYESRLAIDEFFESPSTPAPKSIDAKVIVDRMDKAAEVLQERLEERNRIDKGGQPPELIGTGYNSRRRRGGKRHVQELEEVLTEEPLVPEDIMQQADAIGQEALKEVTEEAHEEVEDPIEDVTEEEQDLDDGVEEDPASEAKNMDPFEEREEGEVGADELPEAPASGKLSKAVPTDSPFNEPKT